MPLYDFNCKDHGSFEVLRNSLPKSQRLKCPECGKLSALVWPKTVMKPDSLWAGHVIENHGYFTSETRLGKSMARRKLTRVGDRTDMDGMKKMAEESAKARDAKFEKESRQFMRDEMAKRGLLDSDGHLRPEASEVLSDTPLISTKDDRVK